MLDGELPRNYWREPGQAMSILLFVCKIGARCCDEYISRGTTWLFRVPVRVIVNFVSDTCVGDKPPTAGLGDLSLNSEALSRRHVMKSWISITLSPVASRYPHVPPHFCRNRHVSPCSLPRLHPMLNISFKRNWLCVPTLWAGLNRPTYAWPAIVDTVSNFWNLNFLVPNSYYLPMYRKQCSSLTPRICLTMRPATSTVNSWRFIKISVYQDTITVACLPNILRKHITVLS